MRISFISPTSLIRKYGSQGDFTLALAHLIDNDKVNDYEQAILDISLPIILDNSLFEQGVPEEMRSVIEKGIRIGATHFFAPDYLYQRETTEQSVDTTYALMEEMGVVGKIKMAAVVQANNPEDYIESYLKFVDDPRIDLIGLSILSIPESFKEVTKTDNITINRIECLHQLATLPRHKDSHMLGAGSSYRDVALGSKMDWVVSHDSSSAVWNGVQGKRISTIDLSVDGGKTEVPVDFGFKEELTEEQESTIQHNIEVILEAIK